MEGKTNFSRRLQTVRNRDVECLEIIDAACNLKVRWLDLTDPDPHIIRQMTHSRTATGHDAPQRTRGGRD